MENFPDFIYIEQIRQKLWSGREYGQASIMVGAGFSLNAEKTSPNVPDMPLWSQLGKKIYDDLYPPILNDEEKEQRRKELRSQAIFGPGTLRLAHEYEVAFGRDELNNIVHNLIPDNDFEPGKLHKMLLQLPWSDVFTTNYDTLIERTKPFIIDKKYDVIYTPCDIFGKMKPRIVKLHGSLPSYYPFILTDEDYRKYRKDFAPFVNMVQQSLMENILCLIGFSGDDPNFLQWIGWVRDNLGTSGLSIYLCGLINLSSTQKALLKEKGIETIDLAPLFPEKKYPDRETRHRNALEWFFRALMEGASANILKWPESLPKEDFQNVELDNGLPVIPQGPSKLSDPGQFKPKYKGNDIQDINSKDPEQQKLFIKNQLKEITSTWRKTREEYPGWIVCPKDNRDILFKYTREWITFIIKHNYELDYPDNLLLLFELNWRLETLLLPFSEDLTELINLMEEIVKSINPEPNVLSHLTEIKCSPQMVEFKSKKIDWKQIKNAWVNIVLALIRVFRERFDDNKLNFYIKLIIPLIHQNYEWKYRFYFEKCVYNLSIFNYSEVKNILRYWNQNSNLPYWELKRASILAELKQFHEAEPIAEAALSKIREGLKPYKPDYYLLSLEGYAMLILRYIKRNIYIYSHEVDDLVERFQCRWYKLDSYKCNPLSEMKIIEILANFNQLEVRKEIEIKRGFNLGEFYKKRNYSDDFNYSDYINELSYLRFFEVSALPLGLSVEFQKAFARACIQIDTISPLWTLSLLIRSFKFEELKEWFNMPYIALLDRDIINKIYFILKSSLENSIKDFKKKVTFIRINNIGLIAELLSRLSFKLDINKLNELLKLTISMYKNKELADQVYSNINNLFERIFKAMPTCEIINCLPYLLSLPIVGQKNYLEDKSLKIQDPFVFIEFFGNEIVSLPENSKITNSIRNLINMVRDSGVVTRNYAIIRLMKLNILNLLKESQKKEFANVLWNKADKFGRPQIMYPLSDMSLLFLPEPESGKRNEIMKNYYLSKTFPLDYVKKIEGDQFIVKTAAYVGGPLFYQHVQGITNFSTPLFKDNNDINPYINWTQEEAIIFVNKAKNWWNKQKEILDFYIQRKIDFRFEMGFNNLVFMLLKLLAIVVLPKLKDANNEIKSSTKDFIYEIKQYGFDILPVLPIMILFDENIFNEVLEELNSSLSSMEEDKVDNALLSVYYWLAQSYNEKNNLRKPPESIIKQIVSRVYYLVQPGLSLSIEIITQVIKGFPDVISIHDIEFLCNAIIYYLDKETNISRSLNISEKREFKIPEEDVLRYRKLISELSYQLYKKYNSIDKIHSITENLKSIFENDLIPDVKEIWANEKF